MPQVRLDKYLSDMGIASRKELRSIIKSGRVSVDGRAVCAPETKISSESRVCLDGEELRYSRFHYYMMNKPAGVLSATEDGRQRTVLDLVSEQMRRQGLFPVGRLDKDTCGLLLLTDDGDFAHRVISPKSGVEKLYYARVEGEPCREDAEAFEKGIVLADGTQCLPAKLQLLGGSECLVTVMEGKYHQVKRMLASRGTPVLELKRLRIGALDLDGSLAPGEYRELTENDLCKVFNKENMEN